MSADNAGSPYVDGFRRAETDNVSYAYVLPLLERDLFRILSATSARGRRGIYVARAYFESVEGWVMDDRTLRKLIPPWPRMSSRELRTAKTIFVACALRVGGCSCRRIRITSYRR